MKAVEIEFEVSDDGSIVTYRIPGEVPGEVHAALEAALTELEAILGAVVDRKSLRPGHVRGNKLHGHDHRHIGGHHHPHDH